MAQETKVGLLSRAVAAQLRRTRAERGWTQQELADALTAAAAEFGDHDRSLSRAVVVAIEQEQRPVRLDELPAMCQALGMTSVQLTQTGRDIDADVYEKILAVTAADRTIDGQLLADERLLERIRDMFTDEIDRRVDQALRERLTAILASLGQPGS